MYFLFLSSTSGFIFNADKSVGEITSKKKKKEKEEEEEKKEEEKENNEEEEKEEEKKTLFPYKRAPPKCQGIVRLAQK